MIKFHTHTHTHKLINSHINGIPTGLCVMYEFLKNEPVDEYR